MLKTEQILQNRYQLKQKLGQNASRQTWIAQDLNAQERVVVKLLTFSDQMQWDNLRLFEREAQVLKQLNHPQIPKYRDYFCIDDRMLWFGLVQEYLPGSSLKELLAQGKTFSEQQVRAIAQNVLNILIYLHGLSPPVLHRDIKPSNLIWVTPPQSLCVQGEEGEIYLVDFGAVQDRAAAEGATFTVVGTYGYAPLEQLGGRATPASDLYALGATLIHLLTGIAPADLPQQEARLQFADRVRLNPGFVRWLGQLTEPNVSQRFSTAQQALEALKENQSASYAIAHSKPSSSQIQLKKSPSYLKIKIPVRWSRALAAPKQLTILAGLALCIYLIMPVAIDSIRISILLGQTHAFPFALLGWLLVGLLLTGGLLLPAFGETTAYFNHHSFEIEWKLFGVCLRRQRGQTLEIDKVFKSETRGYSGKKIPEVTLAAGVKEFVFGKFEPPLSHAECYWLVGEIKNWLGLK
ncbi:MAG: serine/threonine-protein kinase [Cyanobacteriota bacterium]